MEVPHQVCKIDVNNPYQAQRVFIAGELDKQTRFVDVYVYSDSSPLTISSGTTATANYVTNGALIKSDVSCEVNVANSKITVPVDYSEQSPISGTTVVEIVVRNSTGKKILHFPAAFIVEIKRAQATHAQINNESSGTYAEVVQEIAGARGESADLSAALAGKLSASDGAVGESNIAEGSVSEGKIAGEAVSEAKLSAAVQAKLNAVPDTTLTLSGKAADSKAVGEAAEDIRLGLNMSREKLVYETDVPATVSYSGNTYMYISRNCLAEKGFVHSVRLLMKAGAAVIRLYTADADVSITSTPSADSTFIFDSKYEFTAVDGWNEVYIGKEFGQKVYIGVQGRVGLSSSAGNIRAVGYSASREDLESSVKYGGRNSSTNNPFIIRATIGIVPGYSSVQPFVENYLAAHPELTTTVEDGSVTPRKIAEGVQLVVTPEYFGAAGNGIADDTEAIQAWINAHSEHPDYVFSIPANTYAVSSPLVIDNTYFKEQSLKIDFGNATIKALTDNMEALLKVNTNPMKAGDSDTSHSESGAAYRVITGGIWDGDYKAVDIFYCCSRNPVFRCILAKNAKTNYFDIVHGSISVYDCKLDRTDIPGLKRGTLSTYGSANPYTRSVGFNITDKSSDSKISYVRARNISTFAKVNGGGCFFINCHAWIIGLAETTYAKIGKSATFIGCYPDTYNVCFDFTAGVTITMVGGFIYWASPVLKEWYKSGEYPRPIILKHSGKYGVKEVDGRWLGVDENGDAVYREDGSVIKAYERLLNARFLGVQFDTPDPADTSVTTLYSDGGTKVKFYDCPQVMCPFGFMTNLLDENKIYNEHFENLPLLTGYAGGNQLELASLSTSGGSVDSYSAKHLGWGGIDVHCTFSFNEKAPLTSQLGIISLNPGTMTLSHESVLSGYAYNSEAPESIYPVTAIVDIGTYDNDSNTYITRPHITVLPLGTNAEVNKVVLSGLIKINVYTGR